MMKYIVRVEPPLMFNINRNREHDVKEVVFPIGRRKWKKWGEPESKTIIRRKLEQQETVVKKLCSPENS